MAIVSGQIVEAEGSPRVIIAGDRVEIEREFRGPLSDLYNFAPTIESKPTDLPWSVGLESIEIHGERGGLARMVCRYTSDMPGKNDPPEKQLGEIEIDWQVTEVAITRHPNFSSLSTEELLAIEAWRSLPPVAAHRKQKFQYPDPHVPEPNLKTDSHWLSLQGLARNAAELIAKGIDGWLAPIPVVRQRRIYSQRGSISTEIGKISQPPVTIPGYKFICTADNWRRRGKRGAWERTTEWHGFTSIESSLYGNA